MADAQRITTGYIARPLQSELHAKLKRFNVLVIHRRFGKTVFTINEMIDQGLRNQNKNPQYAYFAPFYGQAKRVAWDYLKDYTKSLPGVTVNEADLRVEIPRPAMNDKIRFMLLGADNPGAIRGIYLDGAILDEYAEMDPTVWGAVIRPALSDRMGWAIFIGTPKGQNHFHDLYDKAKLNDLWFTALYKATETGIINPDELYAAKKEMSDEEFEQEFQCFPPETLVSTSRGYSRIDRIRIGDSVLTHRNRWRPVSSVMQRHFDGELVGIKAFGFGDYIWSTPEHPFLIYTNDQRRAWKKAIDVTINDCLILPKTKIDCKPMDLNWVKLIAWFITEGSVNGNYIQLSLNPHNLEEISYVKEVVKAVGYESKWYGSGRSGGLIINNVSLADRLIAWCGSGAGNKRIPFDIVSGHEEEFFLELIKGDGCEVISSQGGRHWMYTTISKGLAFDVQLLAAALGRRAGIVIRPAHVGTILGRTVDCKESYGIAIRRGKKTNSKQKKDFFSTKLGVAYRVREIAKKKYTGIVHNLSVKEDESYVAEGRAVHNCSFVAALVGSYYGKYMAEAEDEGRITTVKYDPSMLVDTYWDLGVGDTTSIWYVQQMGRNFHLIDYSEDSGKGLEFYVREIKSKPYVYGYHTVPHDAAARSMETGRTRQQTLNKLGLKTIIQKRQAVDDGIHAVRMILSRCWFDKVKCARGISGLKNYERKWDPKNKIFESKPKHNWASNPSDAFRYLALGVKEDNSSNTVLPRQTLSDYNVFMGV